MSARLSLPITGRWLTCSRSAASPSRLTHSICRPPPFTYWVAVHGTSLIGVVEADMDHDYGDTVTQLGFAPPHAYVFAIAVSQAHRRRGVGRLLLRQVATRANALGRSFLVLVPAYPQSADTGRVTFFRRCGLSPLDSGYRDLYPYGAPPSEILCRIPAPA
ncbi:GNAT family N-acetyltransferase [Micromonospora purpureochromogenes]|uniref:GNAT family N-acetyltransferase n=1 Tax=Micromonospora purpureochromogenes TaxID=47872 RepID=UPI00363015AC